MESHNLGGDILEERPCPVVLADGRIAVFANRQSTESIGMIAQNGVGGWFDWVDLGGSVNNNVAPAVGTLAAGGLALFVRWSDGSLRVKWQDQPNGGWTTNWQNLGGDIVETPVVFEIGDGRLEVFALSSNQDLVHIWHEPGANAWSPWDSLGKPPGVDLLTSPVVAPLGQGRSAVFTRGSDGALWTKWRKQNWWWSEEWASLGGRETISAPAIAADKDWRLRAFIVKSDTTVHFNFQQGPQWGWGNWGRLFSPPDCGAIRNPAAVRTTDGTIFFAAAYKGMCREPLLVYSFGEYQYATPSPVPNGEKIDGQVSLLATPRGEVWAFFREIRTGALIASKIAP